MTMKKILAICSVVLTIALINTAVQADLYVVAAGKKARRTMLVSPKSTGTQSGTELLSALIKITDAAESNPYLIILEPGVYDVGTSSVVTKSWVDIQGAGEKATIIKGSYDHTSYGVVKLTSYVELSNLTVEHTGSGTYSRAIINDGDNITLDHVTARAPGGASYSKAIYNKSGTVTMHFVTAFAQGSDETVAVLNGGYGSDSGSAATMNAFHLTAVARTGSIANVGIYNYSGTINVNQGKITASGPGIEIVGIKNSIGNSLILTGLTIKASGGTDTTYGVLNDSTECRIIECVIEGSDASVYTGLNCVTYIGNTQLLNPVAAGGSTIYLGINHCEGVCDQNYTFYANTCPTTP